MCNKIKNLRKKINETQKHFGARFGVSRNMVYYWEAGIKKPRKSIVEQINIIDDQYFSRVSAFKDYLYEKYKYIFVDNIIARHKLNELIRSKLKTDEDIFINRKTAENLEFLVDVYPFMEK